MHVLQRGLGLVPHPNEDLEQQGGVSEYVRNTRDNASAFFLAPFSRVAYLVVEVDDGHPRPRLADLRGDRHLDLLMPQHHRVSLEQN